MSTNYSASVVYGYPLSHDDLTKRTPNPLWGKVKFDPETGEKIAQYIETDIELKIKDGHDAKPGAVARYDGGEGFIIGVQLAEMGDLGYGAGAPLRFDPVDGADSSRIMGEIRKVLDKAGLELDESAVGYYLVGNVY